MRKALLIFAACTALAGCAGNPTLVASSCPPFPAPPSSLMAPPPTLDLVPPSLRPTGMPAPDFDQTPP